MHPSLQMSGYTCDGSSYPDYMTSLYIIRYRVLTTISCL
jgi:hypothetical protein